MQGRYVFRRLGATTTDLIAVLAIFSLTLSLVSVVLFASDTNRFRQEGFESVRCSALDEIPPSVAQLENVARQEGRVEAVSLCSSSALFIDNGESVRIRWVVADEPEGATLAAERTIPVDDDLEPVAPLIIPVEAFPTVPLVIGLSLIVWNGRTVGKAIFGLRVVPVADGSVRRRMLVREFLKYVPYYVLLLALGVAAMVTPRDGGDVLLLGGGVAVSYVGATVVWWVLPVIVWRGQMPYDRVAGTAVVRERRGSGVEGRMPSAADLPEPDAR